MLRSGIGHLCKSWKKVPTCLLILMVAGLAFVSFSKIVVHGDEDLLKAYVDNNANYNQGLSPQDNVTAYFDSNQYFMLNFTKGRFWGTQYDVDHGGLEPSNPNFASNASIEPYKILTFEIHTPGGDTVSSSIFLVAGIMPFAVVYHSISADFASLTGGNLSLGMATIEGVTKRAGSFTFAATEIVPYVYRSINETYDIMAHPGILADPPLTISLYRVPQTTSGPIHIRVDGSIDPSTASISTIDNITYILTGNISDSILVERDNIVINGGGYTVQRTNVSELAGIDLTGRYNVTTKSFNIAGFDDGVCLNSSLQEKIIGNNISGPLGSGIWVALSSTNTISGNNITNGINGIFFNSSSNNNVSGNSITDENGIQLLLSAGNNVNGNNVSAATNDGVSLFSCSSNTIAGNNITNNFYGIYLQDSLNNSIAGNNIATNVAGIRFENSSNNIMTGNNVTMNTGVGITLGDSSNNTLYHNNIIDNTEQAKNLDSKNVWDNGTTGNCWGNYNGIDANHDGIGDTPYLIDANNTDRYPLMTITIPEFPPMLILPLLMTATLLAIIAYKRARKNTNSANRKLIALIGTYL